MKYLLDTNVVSELRKRKPHGAVLAWLESVRDDEIALSAVALGELQAGVELTREQDKAKAAEIEAWIDKLTAAYQVLPMDAACFREWARIMHRRPDQLMEDAMIAAIATVHALTIVSRNERDFKQLEISVLNPFKS